MTAALLSDDTMASASGHVMRASLPSLEVAPFAPVEEAAPQMMMMDEGREEGFAESPQLQRELATLQGEHCSPS